MFVQVRIERTRTRSARPRSVARMQASCRSRWARRCTGRAPRCGRRRSRATPQPAPGRARCSRLQTASTLVQLLSHAVKSCRCHFDYLQLHKPCKHIFSAPLQVGTRAIQALLLVRELPDEGAGAQLRSPASRRASTPFTLSNSVPVPGSMSTGSSASKAALARPCQPWPSSEAAHQSPQLQLWPCPRQAQPQGHLQDSLAGQGQVR